MSIVKKIIIYGIALSIWFNCFIAFKRIEVASVNNINNAVSEIKRMTPRKVAIETFDLINKERIKNGLAELRYNRQLEQAGFNQCEDIMAYDYWSHNRDGKNWEDFAEELGIEYKHLGNNIAKDFYPAGLMVKGWMESQRHRDNILGDYEEVGIGAIIQEDGSYLACCFFKGD